MTAVDREERAGVVLAGGYSTRFGEEDKALATVEGEPMVVRVVTRLGAVVDAVVLNCRADQRAPFERALDGADCPAPVEFAIDAEPDRGPLAGVATALAEVDAEYAAVVACDMPWVDPDLLAELFARAVGSDAAVPELEGGQLRPAQAVYRTRPARAVAQDLLASGRHSLHAALDRLDVAAVPVADLEAADARHSLRDVDSRADLDPAGDGD